MNETSSTGAQRAASPAPAGLTSPRDLWSKSPTAWKVALVLALAGFVFKAGGSTKRSVNGVVESCDGFDLAPFLTGGAVALLAVVGYRSLRGRHPARRLGRSATLAGLGVLLALAAFHLGRGLLDPSGSFC
jgi:hypothetical protein